MAQITGRMTTDFTVFTRGILKLYHRIGSMYFSAKKIIYSVVLSALIGGSGVASNKPTIYSFDLRNVSTWPAGSRYDYRHVAVCIQGLANREAPRVFLNFNNLQVTDASNDDSVWLSRLQESGGLCEGWNVKTVADLDTLINTFRPLIKGLILYEADAANGVRSTSLVATTVAACEDAIAVRKDTSSGSMYNYLTANKQIPVILDLTGKFTGSGTIWQTSIPSTGSAKCDAYIWAKTKYLDTGKCSSTDIMYTMDLWGLKVGYDLDAQLSNLDYAVSKKAFCFELSPWGDERPNDDPTQPLGTDLNTYKAILHACNLRNNYNKMIKFCGFVNYDQKYTSMVGGYHIPSATEWEMVRLGSAYNTYMEAEAPNPRFVSNCSFYASLAPAINDRRYVQNPPPTYNDMVNRGLISTNGQVVAGNYVLLGIGDYDGGAWTLYALGNGHYNNSLRGQYYYNWAVNPQLVERVSVAIDYMYRHKTAKDYFVAWDSGAGYINPSQLYGTRNPSGYSSAVALWNRHCKDYYRRLDYSVSALLLNGYATLTSTDISNYVQFSGDGIVTHLPYSFTSPSLIGNIPAQARKLDGIIDYATGVNFAECSCFYGGLLNPTVIKNTVDSYASSGHHHVFMDAYTYFYLLRYYLGGNNNYRATWVSDTIPRVMTAGQSYPVTVTVRNDGWDSWSENSMYRLGYAIVASDIEPAFGDYDARGRFTIPSGAIILPGQSVTFSVTITAPSVIGSYDIHYDMVRDGIAWFRSQNNIEWKKQIIVAASEWDVDTDNDGCSDVWEQANSRLYWHPDDAKVNPLNCDGTTDLIDFAVLSGQWQNVMCSFTESGGVVVIEAEQAAERSAGQSSSWVDQRDVSAIDGKCIQALPDGGVAIDPCGVAVSPCVSYYVNFTNTGIYYLWLRGSAPDANADSVYYGIDGTVINYANLNVQASFSWMSSGPAGRPVITIGSSGVYRIDLWMREDGAKIDRLLLTRSISYSPVQPAESSTSCVANAGDLNSDNKVDIADLALFIQYWLML